MRDDDQVSDGVHSLVAGDAERRVDLHRERDLADHESRRDERHAARCGKDEVRAELADAGHHRDGPILPPERRDRDAAVEARAGVRERVGSERRQRVVEPVERALEEVEHGHVVPRRRQRRGALRPDESGADHDDATRTAREGGSDPIERRRVGVDICGFDPRDGRRRVAQPGREDDRVGVDLGLADR